MLHMTREDRIKVFHETIDCVKNGFFINKNGDKVSIPTTFDGLSVDNTTYYDEDITKLIDFDKLPKKETKITVVNMDCIYAAQELIRLGRNPVVINNASFKRPGGGVEVGSGAQEENIFRRSNLFESLYRFSFRLAKDHGLPIEEKQYPLPLRYGAIYSPNISVFRGGEDVDYAFLDENYVMDFITIAAIKHPAVIDETYAEIMKGKIRMMLNLGLHWENDSIVLGAFGCGAYGNPPEFVSSLYKEVLSEDNYKDKFENVVFAILDDGNAHREHNPRGNFVPFKEKFEKADA